MIEKLLMKLINKERLLTMALSFILGASTTALGVNAEVVLTELCKGQPAELI